MKKKILVVAAHPDDEILGCGGTIAEMSRKGHAVYTLILGEGICARGPQGNLTEQINKLKKEMFSANKILGVKRIEQFSFPDNAFDSIPLLKIVKAIEEVKGALKPNVVFTHHGNDVNVDHRLTYQAVLAACRPLPKESVKEIYSFYTLSSTDYQISTANQTFSPTVFVDIQKTISKKVSAMKAYKSEIRPYPHPRSDEGIKIEAQRTGLKVGLKYAEAFELLREVRST